MEFKHMVATAASRFLVTYPNGEMETIVVADVCHYGRNMQGVLSALKRAGCKINEMKSEVDRGQGFLDESGNFLNRRDAFMVATESGQPLNTKYVLVTKEGLKLDSSCIRHFPDDPTWRIWEW